jgi:hypothetical protein
MNTSITKKLSIGLIGLLLLVGAKTFALPSVGYNEGYAPEQPVPFSHQVHAGKLTLDCRYCHTQVDQGRHAGVPSLSVCMRCHGNGKFKDQDRYWWKNIREQYDRGLSVPWVKVHMLPDFVQFNHQPHIMKGVACQTCHGPVQEMKRVYQHTDLSMGWCVNCHRKPENNAPTHCATCHY